MKILNLYAGIGGNRKLWGDEHQVTAVEYDAEIAGIYKDYFPNDNVIIADAHEFLLNNYKYFDFIWTSPPCPTHSDIRRMAAMQGQYDAMYPDFKLWQEVTLLKHFATCKYVVENVKPYYEPIVNPTIEIDRHYFWTNITMPKTLLKTKRDKIHQRITGKDSVFGFDISNYKLNQRKDKILRNMVNPEIGKAFLDRAINIIYESTDTQKLLF